MTSALTQDTMLWTRALFGQLWKFFAYLTIPGTNITLAEAIVSMAAISIIIYLLKTYSYMFTSHSGSGKKGTQNAGRNKD